MMKMNKIKEMSSPDLEKELGELKTELFKLRFSLATNGLDNPMKIKEVKKDIARINTELRQRELANKVALLGVTLYNSDISRIENQTLFVRDYEQKAICKVLNISCEQLYENTDKYFS